MKRRILRQLIRIVTRVWDCQDPNSFNLHMQSERKIMFAPAVFYGAPVGIGNPVGNRSIGVQISRLFREAEAAPWSTPLKRRVEKAKRTVRPQAVRDSWSERCANPEIDRWPPSQRRGK